MKSILLSLALFLFSQNLTVLHSQVYVNHAATGANDGSSWDDAYSDLNDAVTNAEEDDEIWVAEGTYKPAPMNGDTAATFLIEVNLKLYGGFVGTETTLAERGDPADHPTTLSGDLNGDDVDDDFANHRGDNVKNVVTIEFGTNVTTIVNGFTIRNGHADGPDNASESRGGAIYSQGAPIIQRCSFFQNYAVSTGGAIDQSYGPFPGTRIEDCHFEGNLANIGGAISIWDTPFLINDCAFQSNRTFDGQFQANGGAVRTAETNGTLQNSQFIENEAFEYGGGIANWFPPSSFNKSVSVINCELTKNTAGISGAGMGSSAFGSLGSLVIDSCRFTENTAPGRSGFSCTLRGPNSTLELKNSEFSSNTNEGPFSYGTIAVNTLDGANGSVIVDNCIFENGQSAYSGGLEVGSNTSGDDFDFTVSNSSFLNNKASFNGGGLTIWGVEGSTPVFEIENCLIEGNNAIERAGGLWIDVGSMEFQATIKRCRILGNNSSTSSGIDFNYFGNLIPKSSSIIFENCLIAENTGAPTVLSIEQFPDVQFLNCTIANNEGGGLSLSDFSEVTLQNTILANPGFTEYEALTADVSISSSGGNLILDNSLDASGALLSSDQSGTAPDYDGEYFPMDGGNLINRGNNNGILMDDLDMAGNPRIQNDFSDIGAYESGFTTSSREVIAGKIELSPNPATDFIRLQLPEVISQPNDISLFDFKGKLVEQRAYSAGQVIRVGHLPSGFYTLKLTDGEWIYVGKFIKQ